MSDPERLTAILDDELQRLRALATDTQDNARSVTALR